MTTYGLDPELYSLNRMKLAAESLGGGAAITGEGVPILSVSVPDGVTLAQVEAAYAAARQRRSLIAIYLDLLTLDAATRLVVWNNLNVGSPKKYLSGRGANVPACIVLDWAVTDSGATGGSLVAARLRIAAMYCQDNPGFLVNPAWAPAINIPGDEPAV